LHNIVLLADLLQGKFPTFPTTPKYETKDVTFESHLPWGGLQTPLLKISPGTDVPYLVNL